MKLATLRIEGESRIVGVVDGENGPQYLDLAAFDPSIPSSMKVLLSLENGLANAALAIATGLKKKTFVTGTLQAPIPNPSKVVCIGLNYRDHAIESGSEIPTEPVVFGKFSSTVIGPDDAIELPAVAQKVDYEAELVVVIGKRARRIPEAEAHKYVAGYCCGHDVSARDWQLGRPGGQWLMGKTADTFAPIGPWLVTADEIPDPQQLKISLRLNGETMQNSSTKEFIFGIDRLIAHVTQLVTLEPGDLIFTGTPPGVGGARKPPVWLKPGDTCEVEIEGLGVLRNPVRAEK